MQDGTVRCRFISGKTRVAPVKKVSVPRVELLGAVTAVRLAETVQLNLKIEIEARFFFTDSSAVLGMIRGHCASFQEFVGTRVGEIKSKSNPEKEWYWVPTDCNACGYGNQIKRKTRRYSFRFRLSRRNGVDEGGTEILACISDTWQST